MREFDINAPQASEQDGILRLLQGLGIEAEVDPDMGTVFVKEFEHLTCCKGFINSCDGVECQSLGMCS